ncbi:membrane-spanning 4-domains subfamily A member 7 isoform X1 [Choloepus didactylus]|uniref:membrane-spanning 4-domains subfamily A member 7 isoform X1 n=1 Tax=Choloepus didactylus TaxID=27675 RepID=UPI0018A06AA1|nr:membrane-spanning 4-domains subfamily A member 7 isoform X1 [Choloepus didactylus]
MLAQPKTKGAFDIFNPKGVIIPPKQKPGLTSPKEDTMHNGLQKEATVLGTIQILSCLMIASLGTILVSASHSSHFNPAVSTILMSGYPFIGALYFALTGSLSIISGRKSTKPLVLSSLILNAVSLVAAGAGLILLAHSLAALGSASRQCRSEQDHLSALPYSEYYYSIYEIKDCLLAGVSLTGVLVVMLIFSVLELLLAVYGSFLWWTQFNSSNPGSAFFLPWSQDHIQHVKKSSSKTWI